MKAEIGQVILKKEQKNRKVTSPNTTRHSKLVLMRSQRKLKSSKQIIVANGKTQEFKVSPFTPKIPKGNSNIEVPKVLKNNTM